MGGSQGGAGRAEDVADGVRVAAEAIASGAALAALQGYVGLSREGEGQS